MQSLSAAVTRRDSKDGCKAVLRRPGSDGLRAVDEQRALELAREDRAGLPAAHVVDPFVDPCAVCLHERKRFGRSLFEHVLLDRHAVAGREERPVPEVNVNEAKRLRDGFV